MVLFRGRPSMSKAPKPGPKREKKTDDKPSQEILDQMRYLGERLTDPNAVNNSQLALVTSSDGLLTQPTAAQPLALMSSTK